MSDTPNIPNTPPPPPRDDSAAGPPPRDELDGLLRQWHGVNAQKAAAGRDRLMAALGAEGQTAEDGPRLVFVPAAEDGDMKSPPRAGKPAPPMPRQPGRSGWRRVFASPLAPLAAAAVVAAALLPFMLPSNTGVVKTSVAKAPASNVVMAAEAGRLDALDKDGNLLGPCVLKHTDVQAEISGRFSRVTVKQEYHNPHPDKIEAVYTFPLSERSGVDRMTMTIGDRVIEGEVHERSEARRTYEQARDVGRTASLLEQERPNIFTQSVANIEPGATITIEISYVETVTERDGELSFSFPTVVSPRYIPGESSAMAAVGGVQGRRGVVLAAPAMVKTSEKREGAERSRAELARMLAHARPIESVQTEAGPAGTATGTTMVDTGRSASTSSHGSGSATALGQAGVWYDFTVEYPDGSQEPGMILADGRGEVGGRWFTCDGYGAPDEAPALKSGEPFALGTSRVPDADRITPMPTRPDLRAGHDISIAVTLDSGGPGIVGLDSPLHKTVRTEIAKNGRGEARRMSVALANLNEIPNKDFVLRWKQASPRIGTRVFANTGEKGNFFCVQLEPPARVADEVAMPRELVFVVDTSGSMEGKPLSLARTVIQRAIDAMRPQDRFNVIGLSGATRVLWDSPRPNTEANRAEALGYVETWQGSGGTEMMGAIEAALDQRGTARGAGGKEGGTLTIDTLETTPADGREVRVLIDDSQISADGMKKGGELESPTLEHGEKAIACTPFVMPEAYRKRATTANGDETVRLELMLRGKWETSKEGRVLRVSSAEMHSDSAVRPLRIAMFLTDGEVGNDYEIIQAIKRHRATTRVFPFGIGNSVNRFLIEQMAIAGGGEPEYVYISGASDSEADAAVERFNRRTKTPLLTDISATFQGVKPVDVLPATENVPDLWDNRALTFIGRYTEAGTGLVTIRGQAATGKWEETIPLVLPEREPGNTSLPTLWARGMIDELMGQDLMGLQRGVPNAEVRGQIIRLGETFNVMSPFTSFVAVDKLRVTVDGKTRLVRVPVELPAETSWEGYFGVMPGTGGKPAEGAKDKHLDALTVGKSREPARAQTESLRLNREGLERAIKLASEQEKQISGQNTPAAARGDRDSSVQLRALEKGEKEKAIDEAAKKDAYASKIDTGATPPPAAAMPVVTAAPTAKPGAPASGAPPAAGVQPSTPPPPPPPLPTSGFELTNEMAKRSAAVDGLSAHTSRRRGGGMEAFQRSGNTWRNSGRSADDFVVSEHPELRDRFSEVPTLTPRMTTADTPLVLQLTDASGTTAGGNGIPTPDPAMAGCMMTIAAAQLADEGRMDEARQVACTNANVMDAVCGNLSNSNNDWKINFSGYNSNARQATNVAAPANDLCVALNGKLPDDERKAAIDRARNAATAEFLENRRAATVMRKLSPELLARTVRPADAASSATEPTGDQRTISPSAELRPQAPATPGGTGAPRGGQPGSTRPADSANKVLTDLEKKRTGVHARKEEIGTLSFGSAPGVLVSILVADTTAGTIEALRGLGAEIEAVKADAGVVVARVAVAKLEELALLELVKRVEIVPE